MKHEEIWKITYSPKNQYLISGFQARKIQSFSMQYNRQHFNFSQLSIPSTAKIIHNLGFTTTQSTALHALNNLMILYFEQLCRNGKCDAEIEQEKEAAVDLTKTFPSTNLDLAQAFKTVGSMSHSNENELIGDLRDYMACVTFHPDPKPLPIFPVQKPRADFDDTTLAGLTFDMTTVHTARDSFPCFAGASAKDLGMQELIAETRYATAEENTSSNGQPMDDTVDSLASPILELRRIRPSHKKRGQKRQVDLRTKAILAAAKAASRIAVKKREEKPPTQENAEELDQSTSSSLSKASEAAALAIANLSTDSSDVSTSTADELLERTGSTADEEEEKPNVKEYKAVHSIEGLKVRLLNVMADTPPGYQSARTLRPRPPRQSIEQVTGEPAKKKPKMSG